MKHGRWVRALIASAPVLGMVAVAVAGASPTIVDRQANKPQVAGAPASDTTAVFPTNKQNEPAIAVADDGAKLIAGSNDEQEQPACGAPSRDPGNPVEGSDCGFFPGVGTSGVYTSDDAGSTWTNRGLLDDQPGWRSSPFVSDGDPVIVYGDKPAGASAQVAYYASLASYKPGAQSGNQIPEVIAVSKSTDNGHTWSGPAVAASATGQRFNDKPALAVDRGAQSPFRGRVYVTYTEFRPPTSTAEPVMVVFSTDGGRTWSNPNQLSSAFNNGSRGGRQGSAVAVGRDGTVYVAWEDGTNQVLSVSHDGGVSWSKKTVVGPVVDLADPIPGTNFRTDSFLTLAADDSQAGRVYASWATAESGVGRVVVYRTTDGGGSWTNLGAITAPGERGKPGYAFFQGLDVTPNGSRVDVGFQAVHAVKDPSTYGTGNALVDSYYVSWTPAGGLSAPVRVSSASSDPAASAQNNLQRQFWGDYNTLVSSNTRAWFIYTDSRNGVGCPAVDAYQIDQQKAGLVTSGDDEEGATTGKDKQSSGPVATVAKPAPGTDCPHQFGNTDVYVSRITAG